MTETWSQSVYNVKSETEKENQMIEIHQVKHRDAHHDENPRCVSISSRESVNRSDQVKILPPYLLCNASAAQGIPLYIGMHTSSVVTNAYNAIHVESKKKNLHVKHKYTHLSCLENHLFFWREVTAAGVNLLGIEAMKSKYSPPSLQRLSRSGQPCVLRYLRPGSRWTRPCGNFSIPGHLAIVNRSREVRPSIPSGMAFRALQTCTLSVLSLARSPRFEGSATRLVLPTMLNSSRDAGNFGI